MFTKVLTASVLAISVAMVPGTRVAADGGDFAAGAIIGGIVGHALTKDAQRKRVQRSSRPTYKRTYRSGIPATQQGRDVQASLNYFGFNAGRVDGQLGRQSRSAIANYQAYMGYPATGHLTPFEENLLVTSYTRAQAGGYTTSQQIAANPEGTRGLLKTYRAEMAGTMAPQAPATTIVVAPQQVPAVPQVGTTTTTTVVTAAPEDKAVVPQTDLATATVLPNFLGDGGSEQSLASHCNTVSLLTNTNGGFTTVAAMTDPMQALNEQFCLARTYAIANSEQMISKVQGFTPAQISAQCEALGPALKDHVSALSLKPQAQVVSDVASFILTTGMSPAQIDGTARICLGVGYRTDDMDVALGSALMLFAMGQGVYGELMGHHLAQGFGTAQRVDMARVWYAEGIKAVDEGAATVFAPGQPERTELIRKASMTLGSSSSAVQTTPQVQSASTLPTFTVSE